MISGYDSSWDDDDNEEAWEKKYEEWEKRDWLEWLKNNLSFPLACEGVCCLVCEQITKASA